VKSKEAIRIAKEYIADVFSDERISQLGLEELKHNQGGWDVTLGFKRVWSVEDSSPPMRLFTTPSKRVYKTIQIDEDGSITGLIHRDFTIG